MKIKYTLLFLSLNLIFLHPLLGQITNNFDTQKDSLESKLKNYNLWLNDSNIGQVLSTHVISTTPYEVSLYLKFNYSDSDSATIAWKSLKENFFEVYKYDLEKALFYSMVNILEVDPSKASLQIYDNYNLDQTPCLFVGIRYLNDSIQVDNTFCKAGVDLDFVYNSVISNSKSINLSEKIDRNDVYNYIESLLNSKYETLETQIEALNLSTDDQWVFNIKYLRGEIFSDVEKSWISFVLNYFFDSDFDDRPQELLTFKFKYLSVDNGFKLLIELNGKFAAGMFNVREDGFENMEPEFKYYVDKYLCGFRKDLANLIIPQND